MLTFALSRSGLQEGTMTLLMLLDIVSIILSVVSFFGWRVSEYAEKQELWTLRLRLSLWQPYLLPLWVISFSTTLLHIVYDVLIVTQMQGMLLNNTNPPNGPVFETRMALPYILMSLIALVTAEFAIRTFSTRTYLHTRQKAWCGPSRTGIPQEVSTYIGDAEDWKWLAKHASQIRPHSVERLAQSLYTNQRIPQDPTDLLRSRAEMDRIEGTKWVPASTERRGVYQNGQDNDSISLLWGEHLGFQERCSRGIISIPPNLLSTTPKLKSGLCGKAVCLAFGIMARNKGPDPRSLVCNLKAKNSFRTWEEAGIWPHPAKTLRSFYYAEFEKAFSLLGDAYVTAVTELALLLADLDFNMVDVWLDKQFEHQDLAFNLQAHACGANQEDLVRLYRGHYAAMLISLSLVHRRASVRPEVTVFDAVCKLDNVKVPDWAYSGQIEGRRQAERHEYGASLQNLISAII